MTDLSAQHLTESEGAGLVYSLAGGADEFLFAVDPASGVLSFVQPPDFEMPGDADGDNIYQVTVAVTDSAGLVDTMNLSVQVADVFENTAPVFANAAQVSMAENSTFALDLAAQDDGDSEGAGIIYAITGGADAALFAIDPVSGRLSFVVAPDYETPVDLDSDNIYRVSVSATDTAGLSAVQDLQIAVTDRATMKFIFTSGQSLSVGTTATSAIQVLTPNPVDPAYALALDFGNSTYVNKGWQAKAVDPNSFLGFRPLQEYGTETHVSSMIGRLIAEYQAAGLDSPVFTHVNTGTGGRSILQLMVRSQYIFADAASALAATQADDVFAVDNLNGTFTYYRNTGGDVQSYGTMSGRPVFLDNLEKQLALGVAEAVRLGYDVDKDIVYNFIQGQGDQRRGDIAYGYEFLLGKLLDSVDAIAESVLGGTADVLAMISQHRGYGDKGVAIDQIEFVNSQPNVIFGAPEYQFEALYPASVGGDYTHLSPEGYYMMGQQLGVNLFNALTGQEDQPILISDVTKIAADQLLVDFSGVDTGLVIDPSIYSAANGMNPPSDLGFRLYQASGANSNSLPQIIDAQIVDGDTILLQFDRAVTGQFRLYLGRTQENLLDPALGSLIGFGGTVLRDSEVTAAIAPNGGAALADPFLYEYAPIQYVMLDFV